MELKPSLLENEAPSVKDSAADPAGLLWRALRATYRELNGIKALQPALRNIRSKTVDRWYDSEPPSETDTLTTIQRSFTIAFAPRSGSNEICSLLARNGLGRPGEFFQMPFTGSNALVLNSFSQILAGNQRYGVFGSKMAYAHRAALDSQLGQAIPGYKQIDDILPNHHWIWLTRRDKILQAISWCRAEVSNQWASRSCTHNTEQKYPYDFVHVLSRVMLIQASEMAWETYFRQRGIQPFKIVYEDFFTDLDRHLARLIAYLGGLPRKRLGLKRLGINKSTTFKVQRSDESYEIQERFLSDLLRWGAHDLTVELGPAFVRWTRFVNDFGWRK